MKQKVTSRTWEFWPIHTWCMHMVLCMKWIFLKGTPPYYEVLYRLYLIIWVFIQVNLDMTDNCMTDFRIWRTICLVPVRCISSIRHMYTTDFAYDGPIFLSHWVCHIQVHLYNPSNAEVIFGHNNFWKKSKPSCVGIHWIALTEYFQMSTDVPRFFCNFPGFLHHFDLAKLATSSIRVKCLYIQPSWWIQIGISKCSTVYQFATLSLSSMGLDVLPHSLYCYSI